MKNIKKIKSIFIHWCALAVFENGRKRLVTDDKLNMTQQYVKFSYIFIYQGKLLVFVNKKTA